MEGGERMKHLFLISLALFALSFGVSASVCTWDLYNDDFSSGDPDEWDYTGGLWTSACTDAGNPTCNTSISDGVFTVSFENATANLNVNNHTADLNANPVYTVTYRTQFKVLNNASIYTMAGVKFGGSNSTINIISNSTNTYTYNQSNLDVLTLLSSNSLIDNTFSDWVTYLIQVDHDIITIYEDGLVLASLDPTDSSAVWNATNSGHWGMYIDAGAVSLDYLRISSSICGSCDDDSDCDYGEYCNDSVCVVNEKECDNNTDCIDEFGEGYFCDDDTGTCLFEGSCLSDSNCESDQFCNRYTVDTWGFCLDKFDIGVGCTHDNQCNASTCVNESATVEICNAANPLGACYPDGRCEIDNYCWDYGVCFNDSASDFCDQDSDCDADQHCTVETEGASWGVCESDLFSVTDSCQRDTWCDNTTNNAFGEVMTCLEGFCSPDSWECNTFRDGCNSTSVCNWLDGLPIDSDETNHTCIDGFDGQSCTYDEQCESGLCLAGVCGASGYECAYNNPDAGGLPNPYLSVDGYCDSNPSNTTSQFCYKDSFSYTKDVLDGGVFPISPDRTCYDKLSVGYQCDYDYQCESLQCDFSAGSSNKTCLITNTSNQDSTVTGSFDACDPSSNGFGFNCPVDGSAITTVEFKDSLGAPINGALCTVSSLAFDTTTNYLTENVVSNTYRGGVDFTANSNINSTVYFHCFDDVHGNVFSEVSYIFLVATNTTNIVWVSPRNNSEFIENDNVAFKVAFEDYNRDLIEGGSCTLTLNGDDSNMIERDTGFYETSRINLPSNSGGYEYSVTCTKSGYVSSTSYQSLLISADHCSNGVKDFDETGLDCGGGDCSACSGGSTDNCYNGLWDVGEWGVDCEGICSSSCDWSDCFNMIKDGSEREVDCQGHCINTCESGTCSDGINNGDEPEGKFDCGGRCYIMDREFHACGCISSNDCAPFDGSFYCNKSIGLGQCFISECDSDSDCPSTSWDFGGGVILPRDRFCDTNTNLCRFGQSNLSNGTTPSLTISFRSLNGIPPYNNTIVGNCDERTNGFKVITNGDTLKNYYFATSPFSPAVAADSWVSADPTKQFGEGVSESETDGLIPYVCESMTGEFIYSNVIVMAYRESNHERNADGINLLTYADAFIVNVSLILGENRDFVANITSNRNVSCFVRENDGKNWSNISATSAFTHTYNFTSITGRLFDWKCNTTFGESTDGTFNLNVWGATTNAIGSILDGALGKRFVWHGYYWVITFALIFVLGGALINASSKQNAR